jgi:hypothetical protein
VIAAGYGVWQHVEWRHSNSQFEAIHACAASAPERGSDIRCQGLYNDLTSHKGHAYVGYAVSGALGVGAAVAFVMNAAWTPEESKTTFAPGPTLAGLSFRRRF